MKFLRMLCVLALALCVTASVYAETQSVKVSGDLAVRGIARSDYDFRGSASESIPTGISSNIQDWIMSTTEVEVDAELTDNVSTVIRLVNQRDWNVRTPTAGLTQNTAISQNGNGGWVNNADEFQINLDLAYVTLKDFIYSPLTITIGRQDLWFGKGFIVGANQQNPAGTITAPEYTAINSFDSVKAVLDYDPWTISGIYSSIERNTVQGDYAVNLWGANVGYKFDVYKAEAEGYWFYKSDNQVQKWAGNKGNNDVHTIGLRGSVDPIDVVTVAVEGAYQLGSYVGSRSQLNERDRSAYALDASAELRCFTDKFAWKPKLGLEYILYSGEGPHSNPDNVSGSYTGWDMMFRGKFDSAIREYIGRFYASYDYPARQNYLYSNADASFTNQHQIIFSGTLQPMDSLTLKGNYNLFWTQNDYLFNQSKSGGFIGQEVDLQAMWEYTEDVSFGILGAFFVPGEVYLNSDETAADVVGTVKVNF